MGWASRVLDLTHGPMDDAARLAMGRTFRDGTASLHTLIANVDRARGTYQATIDALRAGTGYAASGERTAQQFSEISRLLQPVVAAAPAGVTGNVATAARIADSVAVEVGRAGFATPALTSMTHEALWGLRHSLDQAWEGIGSAHVMGTLH